MKFDDITHKGLVKWDDAKDCLTKEELGKMIRNQMGLQLNPNDIPRDVHPEIVDRWFMTQINPYRTENFKDLWSVRVDRIKFDNIRSIFHLTFMFLDEEDLETFKSCLTVTKLSQE